MKKLIVMLVVLCVSTASFAATMNVGDFSGAWYTGDAIPDAATPVWDMANNSAAISAAGGMLDIDTMSGGSAQWYLPGAYGAESAPLANRNYVNADLSNPWNTNIDLGYTVEIGVEFNDSTAGTWGLCLWLGEAGGGALTNVQIFKDSIKPSNGPAVYTGDLTGGQHAIRFARNAGRNDTPGNLPSIDVYVDDLLTGTIESYQNGGAMGNSAWNQDWLFLGSLSGSAKYDASIDYIATDFTGAYAPVPEPATMLLLAGGLALVKRRK